jgi:hypothetical protein
VAAVGEKPKLDETLADEARDLSKRLTFSDIMEADDARSDVVPIPEWGGSVTIRSLTLEEARNAFRKSRDRDGEVDPAKLICLTCAFGLAEPLVSVEEAMHLAEKSARIMFLLFRLITDMTEVTEQEITEATDAFRSRIA